ncbi:MAG: rRNA maturation RNase YbeY [Filimonas sp.]|nr:rRNA maturation RNase YbeY [Filimonas sp.]
MNKVSFNYADRKLNLANKTKLKAFIPSIFKKEGKKLEAINYVFCSDEYLLQINKDFLQHDYYTDIITFDLSESDATTSEVYISTDRIKDNSLQLETSFEQEALRVIFHGALHLCGYKDKSKKDIEIMRSMEEKYIKLYFKNK